MHTGVTFGAAVLAVSSMVQLCPAPPIGLAPLISALVTGSGVAIRTALSETGVTGRDLAQKMHEARQAGPPPGVPQEEYDRCEAELVGVTVDVQGPIGNNGIQMNNVPPTCMTLATVLVGDPANGPYPTPCGSACLQYDNLTPDQYNAYRDIFTNP